jgi:hypothetical protein
MPRAEEIEAYEKRLQAARKTLQHHLYQRTAMGSTRVPPENTHGIDESRHTIRMTKEALRALDVVVEDHADDVEAVAQRFGQQRLSESGVGHRDPSRRYSGAFIGFGLGIIGQSLTAWLQSAPLSNQFTEFWLLVMSSMLIGGALVLVWLHRDQPYQTILRKVYWMGIFFIFGILLMIGALAAWRKLYDPLPLRSPQQNIPYSQSISSSSV